MSKASKNINRILLTDDEDFDDDSHEALMSWCEEEVERFLSSPFCSSWKNNKKEIASFFIWGFVDYAYAYHLAKPFQYDEGLVKDVCLNILPRKMSTDVKDFKQVAPALTAFFEWCEIEGILKDTKAIRNTLKKIDSEIYVFLVVI